MVVEARVTVKPVGAPVTVSVTAAFSDALAVDVIVV
jgi:hypothetical protein